MARPPRAMTKRRAVRRPKEKENIESQHPSQRKPYNPAEQADIKQLGEYQQQFPLGWGPFDAFVLSTFDSRPVNTVDFHRTDFNFAEGPVPPEREGRIVWSFEVPNGRRYIMREWTINPIFTRNYRDGGPPFGDTQVRSHGLLPDGANPIGFPDLQGVPRQAVSGTDPATLGDAFVLDVDIAVNGSRISEVSNLRFHDFAHCSNINGKTFILIEQGSTIEIIARIWNTGTFDGTAWAGQCSIFGNSLLSSGNALMYEVASVDPMPVSFKQKEGYEYKGTR